MSLTAEGACDISTDEVRAISVDFTGRLDDGETLVGTPIVSVEPGSALDLSAKRLNSTAITINGASVLTGRAVQFMADATSANAGIWPIEIVCATTSEQTLYGRVFVQVIETFGGAV